MSTLGHPFTDIIYFENSGFIMREMFFLFVKHRADPDAKITIEYKPCGKDDPYSIGNPVRPTRWYMPYTPVSFAECLAESMEYWNTTPFYSRDCREQNKAALQQLHAAVNEHRIRQKQDAGCLAFLSMWKRSGSSEIFELKLINETCEYAGDIQPIPQELINEKFRPS
jgi:hypothetical protein